MPLAATVATKASAAAGASHPKRGSVTKSSTIHTNWSGVVTRYTAASKRLVNRYRRSAMLQGDHNR